MKDNLVSIIMPVYNGEAFIGEAIDSVLAQTYEYWELIVVNDGSTDSTADILASYTATRIRCIYQENQGLAAARNAGIQLAVGGYLAFLDADDKWTPQFLKRCVNALVEKPQIAGIYTGNYFIDETGTVLPMIALRAVEPSQLYSQLLRAGFFPPCAVVVRAEVVREVSMFDMNLDGQGTEDWDLWLRITAQRSMKGMPDPLVYYRVYPGSMSTNAVQMHACRLSVLSKHFGLPDGDPTRWPELKRLAYGYAHWSTALDLIAQGQPSEGWQQLAVGVHIFPPLLRDLSTFYELACGDQSKGYRDQAEMIDINRNGAEMLSRLVALFSSADAPVQALKSVAFGNAYLALGMLSDQAGDWASARRYMHQAVRLNSQMLSDRKIVRRLVKLHSGQSLTRFMQKIAGSVRV